MTGKAYYITTLADWQRHAARFTNSHFIVLPAPSTAHVECGSLLPPSADRACPAVLSASPRSVESSPNDVNPNASDDFVGARSIVPGADIPERSHIRGRTREVEGQGFSPAKTNGAKAPSSSGGRSFSSDITDRREAPSTAQLHPQHVLEVRSEADRAMGKEPATRILVLIEADEGVHLSLDDDPAFEPLPHPLAQKSISAAAQAALAPHGVGPGATTFDAAETLARVHPLLRHRVF